MTEQALTSLLLELGLSNVITRGRNVMACCPFHQESRPSWGISIEPPHKHGCFSCGASGTLRTLLVYLRADPALIQQVSADLITEAPLSVDLHVDPEDTPETISRLNMADFPQLVALERIQSARRYLYLRGISIPPDLTPILWADTDQKRIVFPWYLNSELIGLTGRYYGPADPAIAKTLPYGHTKKSGFFYRPLADLTSLSRDDEVTQVYLVEGELDALRVFLAFHRAGWNHTPVYALGFGAISSHALQRLGSVHPKLKSVVAFFDDDQTGLLLTSKLRTKVPSTVDIFQVPYAYAHKQRKKYVCDVEKLDPAMLSFDELFQCIKRKELFCGSLQF